jgi:hypothetical protein
MKKNTCFGRVGNISCSIFMVLVFLSVVSSFCSRTTDPSPSISERVNATMSAITHGYLHDNVLTSRAELTSDPHPYYTLEPSMHLGSENMTLHAGMTQVVGHMTQTAEFLHRSTNVVMTSTPAPNIQATRTGALCGDGTSSSATGAGACSRHGGVSCWNYSDGSCRRD